MNNPEIVYVSREMGGIVATAKRMARTSSPVLIEGESGTGKELVARLLHASGERGRMPFVAINCGAIPEGLFESELFGYRSGAFTGAVRNKPGIFEAADGGTIFLDEIGDLSPAMQAKCLRVLQEREVRRVGETRPRRIDVRVIAATNRLLEREMKAGRFREDLYFRIGVLRLCIPPLRERPEDIDVLAGFFASGYARKLCREVPAIAPDALEVLRLYAWPGNVRELENEIHRMVALSGEAATLGADLISRRIRQGISRAAAGAGKGKLKARLVSYEKEIIKEALDLYGWNKTRTARHLGLTRQGLHRKLSRLRIYRTDPN
ncbi:MAG: sigma 54-interacting transcriptional regulator [bacterium]|jgi:transcriptional regulator with PAS, ATPase and Fis domain